MFLNMDQLEKQLDKEEFQEIGSMAAFKVDTSKALDTSLVDTKSSGTESKEQDTISRSRNDAHADDADIRPIYDEEPMAEEKGFAIAALKNELRKLTRNSMNTKFAKSSILGKPVLQPHRNQSVVRQPTTFKSERPKISKPWFASQVDVNNDLPKPVTTHYLPKGKEYVCAKPHHMIAPGSSRYSSNDMVHNHYLEEAKKQTQEIGRNSKTSVMPFARSQSIANGSKPKPRISKIFKTVSLRWVPTEKIFTSSTTKVDSEPTNGSNEDITNQYECEQTLNVSAGTLNLSAGILHLEGIWRAFGRIIRDLGSFREETNKTMDLHQYLSRQCSQRLETASYALSWKPCQGDSLNLPDHRIHKDGDGDASFQLKSDSLPHAHAQTTKTFYKHQDSRIMKAQELKTKTSAQTLIYKIFLQRYQVYQGRLLASFQDDAKYEHVGQDTRSQGGKDDQDKRIKI
ncbi:hypothetical protein Tco_0109809 [Tanacetum coccineum]